MERFKTIKENTVSEIEEKRSRFIASIFYIESIEEAEEYIKQKDNYTFNKVIEIEENDNIDLAKLLDIIKRNYKKEKNT